MWKVKIEDRGKRRRVRGENRTPSGKRGRDEREGGDVHTPIGVSELAPASYIKGSRCPGAPGKRDTLPGGKHRWRRLLTMTTNQRGLIISVHVLRPLSEASFVVIVNRRSSRYQVTVAANGTPFFFVCNIKIETIGLKAKNRSFIAAFRSERLLHSAMLFSHVTLKLEWWGWSVKIHLPSLPIANRCFDFFHIHLFFIILFFMRFK